MKLGLSHLVLEVRVVTFGSLYHASINIGFALMLIRLGFGCQVFQEGLSYLIL